MQTEEKNHETRRSKRKKKQRKCFYSFSYVIDHVNARFFVNINSLHYFLWFLLYYLLHLLRSDHFAAPACWLPYKFFIWINEFFTNHPRKRIFRNVNLSNLENVLQRNLRTDRAREYIFRISVSTNFENFFAQRQPWWRLRRFNVCPGLPHKNLDVTAPDRVSKDFRITPMFFVHSLYLNKVGWLLKCARQKSWQLAFK